MAYQSRGVYVAHPECCARPDGTCTTFTPYHCGPADLDFTPIPGGPPLGQRKLRAEFINNLQITGRIHAKARGKELVIAICNSLTHKNFIFRINFRLEAHCFWMPTEWYQNIVSRPPVPRGEKSFAFVVPSEYVDGPARQLLISIQAAFVRPEWTLVFVNHNVMIQFQLMQVSESFLPSDLTPTSKIWPRLWIRTHGPVYHLEPQATQGIPSYTSVPP
ncbi:hypothetical protein B0H16DRAFT_1833154 [Mycena metata]|uniref:Uncharacterized protein n=1 Tax=Mycena metata TaxID=1033252 RepID=A0AAD7J475_9AGAR|nr:hypothetical protein B0H16DRAFT_1833154 [Mycena metata]